MNFQQMQYSYLKSYYLLELYPPYELLNENGISKGFNVNMIYVIIVLFIITFFFALYLYKTICLYSQIMTQVITSVDINVCFYNIKKRKNITIVGEIPGKDKSQILKNNKNIHPEDIDNITNLENSILNGEQYSVETICRILVSDNTYHYFKCAMFPKKEKNIITGIIVIFKDITEKYKNKKIIDDINKKILSAFKNENIMFFELNSISHNILFFNSFSKKYPEGVEIPIEKCLSSIYVEDKPKLNKFISRIFNYEDIEDSITIRQFVDKSEDLFYYTVKIFPFEKNTQGEVIKYIGLIIDNTSIYDYQKRLQDYRNKLKIISDHGNIVIWEYNKITKEYTIDGNDILSEYNFITDPSIINLIYPEDIKTLEIFRNKLIEGEKTDDINIRIMLPNSSEASYFSIGCTPIFINKQGEVIKYIGYRINTSESYYLDLERKRANIAEKSDRMKLEFLANMSHEIRTPLNAIVGFSQIIGETENENDKAEFNNIINYNSEILTHIIDDLLTISRIEVGLLQIKVCEFNFEDIFEKTYISFKHQAISRNIELSINCTKSTCIIKSDKDRLNQILNNLLSNSLKYTLPGGKIEMYYEFINNGIRVSIKDNGIGIAKSKQNKIFCRFEKLDNFAQGTGLGLSICKALIDMLCGEIGFESTEGKGSLFWFWIPTDSKIENNYNI